MDDDRGARDHQRVDHLTGSSLGRVGVGLGSALLVGAAVSGDGTVAWALLVAALLCLLVGVYALRRDANG